MEAISARHGSGHEPNAQIRRGGVAGIQGDICVQRGVILRERSETEDEPARVPVYDASPNPLKSVCLC